MSRLSGGRDGVSRWDDAQSARGAAPGGIAVIYTPRGQGLERMRVRLPQNIDLLLISRL